MTREKMVHAGSHNVDVDKDIPYLTIRGEYWTFSSLDLSDHVYAYTDRSFQIGTRTTRNRAGNGRENLGWKARGRLDVLAQRFVIISLVRDHL